MQDKFLLTLSDEEAAKEMQGLLEASVSALLPAIAETIHRFAQVLHSIYQYFTHTSSVALFNHV